jgi:phosphoribosylformimino-5-aminoimidazole carboxamide ribonucleotide (ProFAR) isomerase
MLLIPAIDLKDGHCVRLKQGDMDDVTVFSEDPAAMARTGWRRAPAACTWWTSTAPLPASRRTRR